ncbi:MAG: hypothetical protein NNA18_06300 [Nitrospira sp.]|nr:hypothetical protein [Nitrospira sp.]
MVKQSLSSHSFWNLKVSIERPGRGRRQLLVTNDRIPRGKEEGALTTCYHVTEWISSADRVQWRDRTLKQKIALRHVVLRQSQESLYTFIFRVRARQGLPEQHGRAIAAGRAA